MEKQNVLRKLVVMLFVGLFASFYSFSVLATDTDIVPPLDGEWVEGKKSPAIEIPIKVSFNGNLLTIQSSSHRSNISICISGDSGFSYEETVTSENTDFITINLTDAPEGTYTLHLTNQWGDHLSGVFDIR